MSKVVIICGACQYETYDIVLMSIHIEEEHPK